MKRFYKIAEAVPAIDPAGKVFEVALDGRLLRTPDKQPLLLQSKEMAEAIAGEWNAQDDKIDPASMPMTGLANAAIDRVAPDRQTFVEGIAAFGETDLFCYRAEGPEALVERQEAAWGKWLRWAQARYIVSFNVISGIMHQPQPIPTVVRLKEAVAEMSDWHLAAASKLTHVTGSLVAVLALVEAEASADEIWPDLILDELWQEEKWGADDFALKNRTDRELDFAVAARFVALSN